MLTVYGVSTKMKKHVTIKEKRRFLKYVDKNTCWEWTGNKGPHGYGGFQFDGEKRRAHRISWQIANGMVAPRDKMVLHTCDNRGCVNPEHLYLGTHQQNMDDMTARDRRNPPKGEEHHASKLTERDVLAMRGMWTGGNFTQRELGEVYNVTRRHVKEIVNNRAWKHI